MEVIAINRQLGKQVWMSKNSHEGYDLHFCYFCNGDEYNDTCIDRRNYKSRKLAQKRAETFVNSL